MMEYRGSLEVEAARKDPCLEALSRQHPSNTLILNCEPPELYENKFTLFEGTWHAVACHGHPKK